MKNISSVHAFLGRVRTWSLTSVVIFFIILLPIAPVFAEGASSDTSSDSSSVSQSTESAVSQPSDDSTQPADSTTQDQATTSSLGTDTTSIDATSGTDDTAITPENSNAQNQPMALTLTGPTQTTILAPGQSDETKHFQQSVDQETGALSYKYPLTIPPGRNGLTPDISLIYNSQDENNQSIFGYGWSSSIPYISRINRHGSEELYTGNYPTFTSSISGELTQLTQTNPTGNPEEGTYGARSDSGDFINYTYSSGVWTAETKDGSTYTFGGSSASRQDDPASSSNIYKWVLSNETDKNSNYIAYSYYKDAGQIYPDTINYTGFGANPGIFEIDFLRQSRTDIIDSHEAGFSNAPNYHIYEIDAKVNGTWVRKYSLAYSSNTDGAQYLLTSVTESGRDSLGTVTTLPAETFDYNQTTTHGWTHSTSLALPTEAASVATSGGSVHTALNVSSSAGPGTSVLSDVNGDGLPDVVESYRNLNGSGGISSEVENVYLYTPSGFVLDPSWTFPVDPTGATLPSGAAAHVTLDNYNHAQAFATLVDVNGDRLPDLVQSTRIISLSGSVTETQNIFINNRSGWVLDTSWAMPVDAVGVPLTGGGSAHVALSSNNGALVPGIFQDINGDGLPDIIQSLRATATLSGAITETNNIYLNIGSGWLLNTSWALPVDAVSATLSGGGPAHVTLLSNPYTAASPAVFLDVNGDGLADLVQSWRWNSGGGTVTEVQNVYLNTHLGWILDTGWSFPTDATGATLGSGGSAHISLNGYGSTGTPIDVNGDGLPDLVQAWQTTGGGGATEDQNIYINTRTGWTLDPTWAMPVDATGTTLSSGGSAHVAFNSNLPATAFTANASDINGDGLPDLVQSWWTSSGGTISSEEQEIYLNNGPKALLSQVTLPSGGTEAITYQPAAQSGSNNLVPQAMQVVHTITISDPVTGVSGTDTYAFNGGTYYYASPFVNKLAGFAMVQKIDAAGNVTKTYYHTGIGTDTSHGEYADMESKIGKIYRVEQYDGSGNLYKVTVNKWDDYTIGTGHDFVKLARTTTLTYDGGVGHRDTAEEFTYDNSTGSITDDTNYGEVSASNDGSFSDTGSDLSDTSTTYLTSSSPYLVLPYDVTTVDQSSAKVREERDYYDNQSLGSATVGNKTKIGKWVTGTTYVNTQKAYNSDGLPSSSTDEDSNTTTYTYDTYNLYPATVTNALSQATNYTYDYATGSVETTTDPNTRVFTTQYDGLGRNLEDDQPDQTSPSTSVTKDTTSYTDTSGAVSTLATRYLDSSTNVPVYTYFDGLGRKIQERTGTEVPGTFNVVDWEYNSIGQLYKQSLPYSDSGSSKTPPTTTAALLTTYTYDPIGRVTSVTNAVGTASNSYSLWNITTTDPNTNVKEYHYDAYNNLVQVDEIMTSVMSM